MIGELLVTAFVGGQIAYTWHLTGNMVSNPLDEDNYRRTYDVHGQGFVSTNDFMSFSVITSSGLVVVEIYLAPKEAINDEYQWDDDVVRAYSLPMTIPDSGQFGLFGDENEGELFEMEPGTYQVIAEARYLQKDQIPPYAELFPTLNIFLRREWESAEICFDAPELWKLTFFPTNQPTEAVELKPSDLSSQK